MAFSDRGSLLQVPPNLYKARFLSATSNLCSGRHSYVLLLAPYLRIQRLPLDVVVTLWCYEAGSRFMDGFRQRKSLQLNQYQQHVVTS